MEAIAQDRKGERVRCYKRWRVKGEEAGVRIRGGRSDHHERQRHAKGSRKREVRKRRRERKSKGEGGQLYERRSKLSALKH